MGINLTFLDGLYFISGVHWSILVPKKSFFYGVQRKTFLRSSFLDDSEEFIAAIADNINAKDERPTLFKKL